MTFCPSFVNKIIYVIASKDISEFENVSLRFDSNIILFNNSANDEMLYLDELYKVNAKLIRQGLGSFHPSTGMLRNIAKIVLKLYE